MLKLKSENETSAGRRFPLTVYAPASIGNVSVGFDALGLALAPMDGQLLGDLVQLSALPSDKDDWILQVDGPFAHKLPQDPEQNIVLRCCRGYQAAARQRGVKIQPLKVRLSKRLPIGSGLGSSASSVVAALDALNRWNDNLLNGHEIFQLMAEMEGAISGEVHLDNIAPSLYGGLRLCPPGDPREFALPWPAAWRMVVCWPGTQLNTREARSVLPESYPRKTVVRHGAQFAQFVHALYTGNTTLAAECVNDFLAEPYRRSLLPDFDRASEELKEMGTLAVGISGSGPTIFALVDDFEVAQKAEQWMQQHYKKNDTGFAHICRADQGGARVVD